MTRLRPTRKHPLPDPEGPWSFTPPPPGKPTSDGKPAANAGPGAGPGAGLRRNWRGLALWLGLIALGVGTYVALRAAFPGRQSSMDEVDALRLLGLLALVSSGLVYARQIKLGEMARGIAIWAGVFALAVLGYSFRGEAVEAFNRLRGELIPAYAVPTGAHSATITASDDGGFYVMGQVNGATVRFAIDTGANGVLLSPDDAARAGIDTDSLKFVSPSETANGVGFTAPVTLTTLSVGGMQLANLPAAVDKTPMSTSLLGMAFLRRLDSFEVKGDQLTLRWRG